MDDFGDLYLVVLPETSRFQTTLDAKLTPVSQRSGQRFGRTIGTQIETEAARTTTGRFLTNNPGLTRSAGQAGLRIGRQLATGVAKQMGSTIVSRAGEALGNKLYEKAAQKFKGSRWEAMLKNPKILAAAGVAGVLIGRKIVAKINGETKTGLKMQGIGARAGASLKTGMLSRAGLGGIGGLIAGALGLGALAGAKGLAIAASDFNETISKNRTIFRGSSKDIQAWARTSAQNLGLASGAALEGAASFGNLFDQLNIGQRSSVKMSKGFVQMASDAASFNNADPSEVMDAFLSATRGEYDALQKFVPTVSAATIQTEALRQTHKKSAGDLTAAEKVTALYTVSMRDLGKAHGDFKRTSGGFANQQRILAANWANLRVQIGQYFLPMFTRAAVYMNTEGFPAIKRIVRVLGDASVVAGRMGKAILGVFSSKLGAEIDAVSTDLTEIADWLETHQTDMVRFFIKLGDGALDFGQALSDMAVGGIRAFGSLAGGLASFIEGATPALQGVMEGLAEIIEIFDDEAAASIREGSKRLGEGAAEAARGLRGTRDRANETADAVKNKMNPIFAEARRRLHAVGQEEIYKAEQRDAAARMRQAIAKIGTTADGSQIKLKKWTDRTKLGSKEQAALSDRVKTARQRMIEHYRAGETAGVKQKELTRRWEKGKEALYREFKVMGLSKDEAKRLAEKYGKIPKKAETKVTQPGMKKAHGDVDLLDRRINNLNSKSVGVSVTFRSNKQFQVKPGAPKFTYAEGGVFPGYTPGRDVHTFTSPTGGTIKASGGESFMVPEWTRAVGGPSAVDRMNHDARSGRSVQRFANGGTFRTGIALHGRTDGEYNSPAGMTKIAGEAYQKAAETHASRMAKWVLAQVEAALPDPGSPGGKVGTVSRSMAATIAAMRGEGARSFTTYPGHHPSASKARDVTPHNWDIANAARASSSVWYVIYRMMIASKNHGNTWQPYHPTNRRGDWQHTKHVHVGWYDQGGELPPGLSLAMNGTGKPETVSPNGGGRPIVINLDLGDGLTQRVEGVIDENDRFKASIGRSRG